MSIPSRRRRALPPVDEAIRIAPFGLEGELVIPAGAAAVVLFAHGSGSSHRSPRNRFAAQALRERGLGTLLFDLLTPTEALDRRKVFDIELLAERLRLATRWLDEQWGLAGHPLGYFGASTGAAAALVAAAEAGLQAASKVAWDAAPEAASGAGRAIGAVVSRGGRPDLAGTALPRVEAPTLLIVGGRDEVVLDMNRDALDQLRCEKRLEIVAGATHLFEEPGTLERAIALAGDWFVRHLSEEDAG